MSELTTRRLADLASIVTGATPSGSEPEAWGEEVDFITPSDQSDQSREARPERRLSSMGAAKLANRIVPPRSTNLTCIGSTIGKVSMCQRHAVTNQQINSVIALDGISDPGYIYYMIKNWSGTLKVHASGSATPIVNKSVLSNFEFDVPCLDTQQAIAEILGALDDKIAANTKLAAAADEWVRASLVCVVANTDETIRVSDLVKNRKELANPGNLAPDSKYLGLEHLPRRAMWADSAGMSASVSSTKAKFERGDILFGKLRPYFHKVVVAPFAGVCSTDILVLMPLSEDLAGFTLASVASDFVVERVTAASEGTRMPRTSWKDLAAVEVPWPGVTEARRFSTQVSALRNSVGALLKENITLAATRDALLPQLMSGKLRVKDAETILEKAGV